MNKLSGRIGKILFAMFVVASLGFGLLQATGTASGMPTCEPEDPNYCASEMACDEMCIMSGHPFGGMCSPGHCCMCLD
ncbi:MAG: hypothetical protein ACRELC_05640 [Gemmatimonadota bacterium]